MIATVTLNPALDEHIVVDGLMIEEANRWKKLRRYAGGKGIDVSRAIHEMGGATIAYGFIGGPNGRLVEILLDEEEVPFSFTPINQETRTNFVITDIRTTHQTRIDAPGPRISKRELERFTRKMRKVRPTPDMVAIGGSAPPGMPDDIYYQIITEAKGFGIRAILDCSGKMMVEGMKAKPYMVKPNIHEAEMLLGKKIDSEADIIQAAYDLVDMGVEIAVISCGKEGIIAATADGYVKATPPSVKVRSSVGAGDCTLAGLSLKLAYGQPLVEACRLGAAMGTAAVLTPGTELCRRADVERLLPRIKVKKFTRG